MRNFLTAERIAGFAAFIATVNPLAENDKINLRRPILTTTSLQNLNVCLFRRPIVCTRVVYSNRSTILEGDTCIMFPVPTNHCTFFPMHTYRESSRGACDWFLFQTLNIWKIVQQEKICSTWFWRFQLADFQWQIHKRRAALRFLPLWKEIPFFLTVFLHIIILPQRGQLLIFLVWPDDIPNSPVVR